MNPNTPHDHHHCSFCNKQFSLFSKRLQCSVCRIPHSDHFSCSKCLPKSHPNTRTPQIQCVACAPVYSPHILSPLLGQEATLRSRSDVTFSDKEAIAALANSLNTSEQLWKSSQGPTNRTVKVTETSSYPSEILLAVNSCREFTPRTVMIPSGETSGSD